ncbi:MAG: 30S ribosome-binding factor RbfA [Nannocystaceae bacterium]
MTQSRTQRIEETLRRAVADVLLFGGLRDPRLQGASIGVTGVKVTPDLMQARVFIDVLGGDDHKREVLTALKAATRVIRSELAARIQMRRLPSIEFAIDSAIERGLRIEAVIAEIHAQDQTRAVEAGEGGDPEDAGASGSSGPSESGPSESGPPDTSSRGTP